MSFPIKPLGARIIVKGLPVGEAVRQESGLILPQEKAQNVYKKEVVAVGPDAKYVAEGQTVLVTQFAGDSFNLEGKEYQILAEADVLALLTPAQDPVRRSP